MTHDSDEVAYAPAWVAYDLATASELQQFLTPFAQSGLSTTDPGMMVVSRNRSLAMGALALLTGIGACTVAAMTPETVNLTFAWPDDLRARVVTEMTTEVTHDSGNVVFVSSRTRYDLATSPSPDGLVISADNLSFEADAGGNEAHLYNFFAQATVLLYDFAVDRKGGFAGLATDDDAYFDRLHAARDTLLANIPEAMRERLPLGTNRAIAENFAGSGWARIVGGWTGETLEKGVTRLSEASPTMRRFAGHADPGVHSLELVGWVPCAPGGPADCVEIEETITTDPEVVVGWMLGQRAASGEDDESGIKVDPEQAHHVLSLRLVTHPDTLVPVSLEFASTMAVTYTQFGHPRSKRLAEQMVVTYQY